MTYAAAPSNPAFGRLKHFKAELPYIKEQKRKRLVCMLLFLALIVMLVPAFCETLTVISSIGKQTIDMVETMTTPSETVTDNVNLGISQSGNTYTVTMLGKTLSSSALSGAIATIFSLSKDIAMALLVIAFCVQMMQGFLDGSNYDDVVIKKLVVLGISVTCIYLSQNLCIQLNSLGNAVTTQIENTVSENDKGNKVTKSQGELIMDSNGNFIYTSEDAADKKDSSQTLRYPANTSAGDSTRTWIDNIVKDTTYSYKTTGGIGNFTRSASAWIGGTTYLFQAGVPYLIFTICDMFTLTICVSRDIELLILIAFAPWSFVALSGSVIERVMQFVKRYFAVVLQGAVILTITMFTEYASIALQAQFDSKALLGIVGILMVRTGLITRSRQISQTILNV